MSDANLIGREEFRRARSALAALHEEHDGRPVRPCASVSPINVNFPTNAHHTREKLVFGLLLALTCAVMLFLMFRHAARIDSQINAHTTRGNVPVVTLEMKP